MTLPRDWAITSDPSIEPITTSDMKDHIKVDISDDDDLIDTYTSSARQYVEDIMGRQFISATWTLYYDSFPTVITVPRPPLQSVTSIQYYDTDGVLQTLSSAIYTADTTSQPGRIVEAYSQVWPSTRDIPNAVIVTVVAGYGATAADVPAKIKQAIKLMVGHWYENREQTQIIDMKELPKAVESLIWTDRVWL